LSGKGKKEGEESKKSKKDAKCYNCKKKGHFAKDCWAPGGGAEGKGPKSKGKGKEKEVVAKVDENGERNSDAVWMVSIGDEVVDEIDDKVASWLQDIGRRSGGEYDLWTEDEINNNDEVNIINDSPIITDMEDKFSGGLDVDEFFSKTLANNMDVDSIPSLASMSDSSEDSVSRADEEISEEPLDSGDEPRSFTFVATILANSVSSTTETELFNSGTSQHMSPYRHKFINFFPIQKRVLTTADGGTFDVIGKGDMHVILPNDKATTRILLKDVLYAPKMGLTLISIGKIDTAGFASLFHKGSLQVFSYGKKRKKLAEIPLRNGLYRIEHKAEIAAVVNEEVVTIEKLHRLMGHISPEAAKTLVQKDVVNLTRLAK
jgi:hypothetical protein